MVSLKYRHAFLIIIDQEKKVMESVMGGFSFYLGSLLILCVVQKSCIFYGKFKTSY